MSHSSKWLRLSSDGSVSAYNHVFDECYHSLKDGALSESFYKHIQPSLYNFFTFDTARLESLQLALSTQHNCEHIEQHIKNMQYAMQNLSSSITEEKLEIHVLDICFGLGYNSFVLLASLCALGYKGYVKIYAPECDRELFMRLPYLVYPSFITHQLGEIQNILYFCERVLYGEGDTYRGALKSGACFELYLFKGEALKLLEEIPCESLDCVYQDAFSPCKNPTLWSDSYFRRLYSLLKQSGIITTYSQASSVRQSAFKAHLQVYDYKSAYVRGSTLMSKNAIQIEKFVGVKLKEKARK